MAAERLSMRQLKEILRQKLVLGRSHRLIARSLGVSAGSVGGVMCRATAAGLDWKQVEAVDEATPCWPTARSSLLMPPRR